MIGVATCRTEQSAPGRAEGAGCRASAAPTVGRGERDDRDDWGDLPAGGALRVASPLSLPHAHPSGDATTPVVPDVPATVRWLLRFQLVTLMAAAILCGLATMALLALSWSLFAATVLLAPVIAVAA